jgi:NADH-quinone oxidoreductase subunit J
MIEAAFFAFFSLMAVAAALSVILQKNPVYSALSLIVVIASMGGLFLLLHAAFLAVLQIIIYAGAIMALFLFVIMMVDIPDDVSQTTFPFYGKLALLLLLLIAGAAIWSIQTMNDPYPTLTADFSVRELSRHIFTTYLFPFEAIGILIISAVIGALYIARKEQV